MPLPTDKGTTTPATVTTTTTATTTAAATVRTTLGALYLFILFQVTIFSHRRLS